MACLRARPRSYQVTPSIPDRRRATLRKEVRPTGRQPETESQLAAGPGPSPPHRTSPTRRIRTASLDLSTPAMRADRRGVKAYLAEIEDEEVRVAGWRLVGRDRDALGGVRLR